MSAVLQIINQIFDLQKKLQGNGHADSYERNFNRLASIFEEEGYIVQDPTNEPYTSSRTDCEASITGVLSSKMKITKTLKPIVYQNVNGQLQLLQKGVVLAEKN